MSNKIYGNVANVLKNAAEPHRDLMWFQIRPACLAKGVDYIQYRQKHL